MTGTAAASHGGAGQDLTAHDVDVAIIGGGLVGAALALALRATRLRVLLVEGFAPDSAAQPSFDDRTTALGNGTRSIFQSLDVWQYMQAQASAIRAIHVSDAGRFGFARLTADEQGLEAFGYVVPNRVIGLALWRALQSGGSAQSQEPGHPGTQLALRVPARCEAVSLEGDVALVQLRSESRGSESWRARLVVAADGAQSLVRTAAGLEADIEDYGQVAVVVNVTVDRPHNGTAYERFTPTGPLAVLPLADGSYTVVWTLRPDVAADVMQLPEALFLARLQQCFGWRAGRLQRAGRRSAYPLQLTRAAATIGRRVVLVGNAAQALHPVAGQGFNLGIRDAAILSELLAQLPTAPAGAAADSAQARTTDPGADSLLQQFAVRRAADRRGVTAFTDNLVKLFASERPGVPAARDLGLLLFDVLPPAKAALSRISWGLGGAVPRLSRGLALRAAAVKART